MLMRDVSGAGRRVVLLGEELGELGGSEYLKTLHGLIRGVPPALDLARERALQRLLVDLAARRPGPIRARLRGGRTGDCAGGMLF